MKFYGYCGHWKWRVRLLAPFWAYLDWKRGERRYMDCLKKALFFPKAVSPFYKHKAGYNPIYK